MLQQICAFFLSILTFFFSLFGVSFEHVAGNVTGPYVSEAVSPGPNGSTEELKTLFAAVLSRTPAVTPCPEKDPYPEDGRITALYFEGEEYEGRPARVFAYIGFPEGASAQSKVPAMVLVHGGGAHAWAPWVQYWVDRGYAAISMDCFGQAYVGETPYEDDSAFWALDPASHMTIDNFASRALPLREQWFYYFISDIILAHNVLRADERVDTQKIGLTGISWGGFAASVAVCYDQRFAFAAPVYGSGFQQLSATVWGEVFRGPGVSDVWDASLLLPETAVPVTWFTGDADPFFSAESASASAAAAPNGAVTLIPGFLHGMYQGIELPELARFADAQTGRGEGNITLESVSFDESHAVVTFTLPADVRSPALYLYYRSTPLEYEAGELKDAWQSKKGIVLGDRGTVEIPAGTTMFYLLLEGKTGSLFRSETLHASSGLFTFS